MTTKKLPRPIDPLQARGYRAWCDAPSTSFSEIRARIAEREKKGAAPKCPECGDAPNPELRPPENDAPVNANGEVWHWGCWAKERTRQHERVCGAPACSWKGSAAVASGSPGS